jgi:transcriptional regulator with XRE-family HTH domain
MGRVGAAVGARLARNVAAERVRHGWSQAEFAERLGVGRTTVGGWESGVRQIGVDHLVELCRVLDVGLAALLVGLDVDDMRALRITPER